MWKNFKERWKQRSLGMNVKKSVLTFIITALILIAGFGAAGYANFGARIEQQESAEQAEEKYDQQEDNAKEDAEGDTEAEYEKEGTEEEYSGEGAFDPYAKGNGRDSSHLRESNHKDLSNEAEKLDKEHDDFQLTTLDKALIIAACIAAAVLAIWYWILCMMWAYRKATRLGVSEPAWVVATLFFNLIAILVLYLYGFFKGTCRQCGRVRSHKEHYCARCGAPYEIHCPKCGHVIKAGAAYCPNCGHPMNEEEASDETASTSAFSEAADDSAQQPEKEAESKCEDNSNPEESSQKN